MHFLFIYIYIYIYLYPLIIIAVWTRIECNLQTCNLRNAFFFPAVSAEVIIEEPIDNFEEDQDEIILNQDDKDDGGSRFCTF